MASDPAFLFAYLSAGVLAHIAVHNLNEHTKLIEGK